MTRLNGTNHGTILTQICKGIDPEVQHMCYVLTQRCLVASEEVVYGCTCVCVRRV